ncbi:hypothetical protein [Vibrio phage 33Fb.4]|nr:hypothetical protein [Vibrio phage 31Fb.4]WAG58465.1 hypothetical protein [Vibrio phage 33Fb.4]
MFSTSTGKRSRRGRRRQLDREPGNRATGKASPLWCLLPQITDQLPNNF